MQNSLNFRQHILDLLFFDNHTFFDLVFDHYLLYLTKFLLEFNKKNSSFFVIILKFSIGYNCKLQI